MKRTFLAIIALLSSVMLSGFLYSIPVPWINGQDAIYVIGQPNFTTYAGYTTATGLYGPMSMAIDAIHSKFYVLDAGRVLRYTYPITTNQPTAELVFGQPDFTSWQGDTTQNKLNNPYGITIDSSGRLWVADFGNNRVIWFDQAHTIQTNQPNADGVLGQVDFVHNDIATTQNGFNHPASVAIDSQGTLFVADKDNNRVLRFDNAANKPNGANADGILGQMNFTSKNWAISQSGMNYPKSVSVFGSYLFVADTEANRVLRFDNAANKPNGANADGILGCPVFNDRCNMGVNPNEWSIGSPAGLTVDSQGRLYIGSTVYNRILIFDNAISKPDGANADYVLGQINFWDWASGGGSNHFNLNWSTLGNAVDSMNNTLLISDSSNHRVLVFRASSSLGFPIYLPFVSKFN